MLERMMQETRKLQQTKFLMLCSILRRKSKPKYLTCTVVLSMPMWKLDNRAAGKITEALNKKILSMHLNVANNKNINEKDIGRRGLHLNNKGVTKFA